MLRFRNVGAKPIMRQQQSDIPSSTMKLICPIPCCVLALTTATAIATPILDMDFATWADTNSDGNLDDGERMQDVSGNGHHGFWGSTTGNIPLVSTSDGPAIDTSGAGAGKIILRDSLTGIPDAWDGPTTTITPYFNFNGSQSYTFEAVVNWNGSTQNVNGMMGQISGNELWIRESGGFLQYAFLSGAANANLFSNTIDISAAKADGQWHVISVVYDATAKEIRSYLDGTLKHTNTDPDIGSLGTMVNGANDFSVGGYNATTNNYFDGRQKRYRISNGALAPAAFLTAPAPQTGAPITWTGGTDANWDTSTAGNWKLDADNSPVLFTDNSPSSFDGSGAAGSITIVGTVAPAALSISSNSPASYTFTGGTLGGTGSINKSGTSTLTLAGPVTRTGNTNLNGGTLVIGDGATSGGAPTGIISTASGATIKISRSDTLDYSTTFRIKELGGEGTIVIDGGGTLIVNPGTGTGFNESTSWSGLSGGVTVIGNSELRTLRNGRTALGTGTVTLGDATTSGALAQYNGSWTWTNPITLVGAANAIRNRSSNAFARILKLQGVISGSGGLIFEDPNGTMTNNQTGYILTGENTTDGTITIATGVPVRIGGIPGDNDATQIGPAASGSLGSADIINNGVLTFSRTDAHSVANTITGSGALFIGLSAGTSSQVVNLTGSATHSGNTTVRSGTLLLNGTHGSTVPEIISQLIVSAGATLGGVGNTSSDVQLNGTLAPGINTGTFATTNWLNLHGGSTYNWDLTLWSGGTPGIASDLATADEIHIEPSAIPATPITVAIKPVALAGFTETNRSFAIAQATTDLVGFNTAAFVIDDSAFVAATGATGNWSIQQNGNNLELLYTAGPALTGYALWISGFEVEDQTALDDDFDQDQVPNGIEFLLGGNPSLPNDVTLPSPVASSNDLVISFQRADQAIGTITTVIQTSTNLVTWPPGDEIVIGETSSPGVNITDNGATDTVVVTIPKTGALAKFARFRTSIP
jgi:autotransporter-associated beta strand protein